MKILSTLALCLGATTAAAQECAGDNQTLIPELEAAKAAFLASDYETFAGLLGENIATLNDTFEETFAPLRQVIDGQFSSCTTVVQRFHNPGFYQDIAAFQHADFNEPIYLFLEGVNVGGEFRYTQFVYTDVPSDAFDNLR